MFTYRIFLRINRWKNFENRSAFVKVTIKHQGASLIWTHCSILYYRCCIPWPDVLDEPANLLEVVQSHVGDTVKVACQRRSSVMPTRRRGVRHRGGIGLVTHTDDAHLLRGQLCCCNFSTEARAPLYNTAEFDTIENMGFVCIVGVCTWIDWDVFNPLDSKGNYSATSNDTKLAH